MSPRSLSLSLAVTVALLATASSRPNSRGILFSGEGAGGTAPRLHRPRWMQPPRRAHGAGRSFYFPDEEVERSSAVPDQPRGGTDQAERSPAQPGVVPDRPIQTFSAVALPEVKPEPPVVVPHEPEVAPERPDSRPQEPEVGPGTPVTIPKQTRGGATQPAEVPAQSEVISERPRGGPSAQTQSLHGMTSRQPEEAAVIPDPPRPRPRPHRPRHPSQVTSSGTRQWTFSEEPTDSGAVIEDRPVPRPDSDIGRPQRPLHTPGRPQRPLHTPGRPQRPAAGAEFSERRDTAQEPAVGGGGSASGSSSGSGGASGGSGSSSGTTGGSSSATTGGSGSGSSSSASAGGSGGGSSAGTGSGSSSTGSSGSGSSSSATASGSGSGSSSSTGSSGSGSSSSATPGGSGTGSSGSSAHAGGGGSSASTGGTSASACASSGSSSRVHFPGQEVVPIPSCGGELFFAYDNATGDCRKLWTEAGCPAGTWFVQSPLTGEAECRTRCCPAGQTLFDGVCWDTSGGQRGPCAAGQGVLLDQFGEGFCDCLARQVYWPAERRCYPVYSRGPCAAGHHLELEVSAAERRAVCRPSRCAQGEVYWGDEAAGVPQRCYSIEELRTDDPCQPGGQLTVDVHTLEISCVTVTLHAVFDPPQVRCPAGSYLDFTGQCREELVQKFRSSFAVVEQPESRSLCPVGFVAKPDGRCVSSGGGLGR